MGAVVAVIVAMLLLLYALDHPFHDGVGGLQPVAMERTLDIIGEQLAVAGIADVTACDAVGQPAVAPMDWLASLPGWVLLGGWLAVALLTAVARTVGGAGDRARGRAGRHPRRRRAADAGARRDVRRAHGDHAVERGRDT